jgi:long-chain fatty acid transport protein
LGLFPAVAGAAGYVNGEQSPAGVGLGGAMVARPDDASAIFYNPAGLGFQSGLSVLAGVSLALPQQSATPLPTSGDTGGAYHAKSAVYVLPTIFAAARVSDKVAVGLGFFVHHGGGADWRNPDDPRPFPGRFLSLSTNLQSFTFNPTVTFRPVPEVAIGGGVDIEYGTLATVRALALGDAEGQISLAGSNVAVGGNAGALVRLLDGRLNFGLSYRSAITMHFQGMQTSVTGPAQVALAFPYTQAATDVSAPHTVSIGVAVKPIRYLTISADAISSLWSNNREQQTRLSDAAGDTNVTVMPRNWNNAYSGRLGLELDLGPALSRSKFWPKVRVGFGYDQSPVPTSTLEPGNPDGDRLMPAAGVSLGYRGLGSLELGYTAVLFLSRTADNPNLQMTYDSMIHVFSAAVNLQLERVFGKRSPEYASRLLERTPEVPAAPEGEGQGQSPPDASRGADQLQSQTGQGQAP